MKIVDGKGSGREAQVDALNRLVVLADARSPLARATLDGDAYSWYAASADIDATDTALLVCNNEEKRRLHIDRIYLYCDVAQQFTIHFPAYPTLAGTAVTAVNLNRSSNKQPVASAYRDETGNTQGSVLMTVRNNEVGTDQFGQWVELDGAVVLGYHQSIAVDLVAEPGAFECTIIGHYEDEE